jgi:hypothetical protein
VEDPLDFVDFLDVTRHGDPRNWTFRGPKPGSPTPATSPSAPSGTMKHYDLYDDEHGDRIELHYFRYPDGSVDDVKVIKT